MNLIPYTSTFLYFVELSGFYFMVAYFCSRIAGFLLDIIK